MTFYEQTISNLLKIALDRHLTQTAMANYMKVSPSMYSRILSGKTTLSLANVAELAKSLNMTETDIFNYPNHMIPSDGQTGPVDAVLQIRLSKENKDRVMSILFGDETIDILNHV